METRANYIAVGFFTLAALAAAFVLVYWFGRYGNNENLVPVDIRIEGSVSGLGPGSLVQFNGINVGRVKSLSLDIDNPRFVVVHTEVNSVTPIRSDTKATVGLRGLSGGAFIQLEGGSPAAPALLGNANSDASIVPQITGDPAALSDLLTRINGIALRTEGVMDTLETFVRNNEPSITRTLANAEIFSKALAANSDGVSKFMESAGNVAITLERLSGQLDGSLNKVEGILAAVDPKKITSTVNNVETFSKSLADQKQQIATLVKSVTETAEQLNNFSAKLSLTMDKVDKVVDTVDPAKLTSLLANIDKSATHAERVLGALDETKIGKTLDDISATASSARSFIEGVDQNAVRTLITDISAASKSVSTILAAIDANRVNTAMDNISNAAKGAQGIVDDVKKVTSKFGKRGDDINQMITDASSLAARLNESSRKIDRVIATIDNLLGSNASNGLVADARRTLATFRQTARNLDQRISEVTSGITSFTKRGLGDTQGLIQDARSSINRIDRVIRSIERNPASLISGAGGSRVRESGKVRPRR
ncbi:MAG: MlaD family protein [Rhizobiaceae bacterium]